MDDEKAESSADKDEEIRKLRATVVQLKNVIKKLTGQQGVQVGEPAKNKKTSKRGRPFDASLYKKRRVLFQIAYFGWDYHGFAVQEIAGKTIESELFRALVTTHLIEGRETSNYHRCGRTDKGVSAFRQAISIDVRTNLLEGKGVFDYEGCRAQDRPGDHPQEIDYCKILNSNLPDHIQVLAWAACESRDFSARFDCHRRTYKYFFPLGSLNLDLLNQGGTKLLGEHDFRNFCKMDVNNGVTNYHRRIDSAVASVCTPNKGPSDPYTMCVLTISGKAFLWHQIRCIVSVLFRIGDGKENPEVIDQLLDLEANPCRPQYNMASEIPLNLFDCEYENLDWQFDPDSVAYVIKQFQALWTEHQVKAEMLRTCLRELEGVFGEGLKVFHQTECLLPKSKMKVYIPLLNLKKCPSLQQKIDHRESKRRKLNEIEIPNTDEKKQEKEPDLKVL